MKLLFLFVCFITIPLNLYARIYIPVDQPSNKKMPIALTTLVPLSNNSNLAIEIPSIIQNDLELTGYFQFIPQSAFLEPLDDTNISPNTINFDYWRAIETQALVKGSVSAEKNKVVINLRLFDPYLQEMLVSKQYIVEKKNIRSAAHKFSDEILLALTGIKGSFNSKIAFNSDVSRRRHKTIYTMDVDGENLTQVTKSRSINISPAWSPDGRQIAFTSYRSGYPELYKKNLLTGNTLQLTRNKFSNIAPRWNKEGSAIFFTTSVSRDPEIWTISPGGTLLSRVTGAWGVDISPTFSPDGREIIFASERVGRLHLFRKHLAGGPIKRLTFVGIHNDTPDWSPDGKKIVFCSQDKGYFDIFIMNADGSFIQRLTRQEGDNEHPRWSPDGRFIVFSSTRAGSSAIYTMRPDGADIRRISKINGALPSWSPRLQY